MMKREDIQHVSDVRLIAMALLQRWNGAPDKSAASRRVHQIRKLCEEIIESGPPEFRFITEPAASAGDVQRELRQSVFEHQRL
jgi:hypothetical protein